MEMAKYTEFERKLLNAMGDIDFVTKKLHHILEGMAEDYFYKYNSENPRDKHAIIGEHKRNATYSDVARECVYDILKSTNTFMVY